MATQYLSKVQKEEVQKYVDSQFDSNFVPSLMGFVRIPNLSPGFDEEWESNGHLLQVTKSLILSSSHKTPSNNQICSVFARFTLEYSFFQAAMYLKEWVDKQGLKNTTAEVICEDGKPPLIYIEVAATDNSGKTALFYGHYDKQPHGDGWKEGLSPTEPVIIGDKLYGRGTSDDGYSLFASILSIKACQELGYGHPKCVVTIEGEEETDSEFYMYFLDKLFHRIGTPDFVFCLDSGGASYDNLWLITSLRGVITVNLNIEVLTEGVHSGDSSGIVPSAFRIANLLLQRIEDLNSGRIHDDFQVAIPPNRYEEAYRVAELLKENVYTKFPFAPTMQSTTQQPLEAYLNKTWRAQLSVIGADGLPPIVSAGNVTLPVHKFKLSLRIPPTLDAAKAEKDLVKLLESNPPYNAKVHCEVSGASEGWNSPDLDPILHQSINASSQNYYGAPVESQAEGGSIPLMNDLQKKWPNLQFLVTGVLGPFSNAHGPNENIDLPYVNKFICCMTQILADTSSNAAKLISQ